MSALLWPEVILAKRYTTDSGVDLDRSITVLFAKMEETSIQKSVHRAAPHFRWILARWRETSTA